MLCRVLGGGLFTLAAVIPAAGQSPGDTMGVVIPGTDLAVTLVYLPGGEFVMGSSAGDTARHQDEGPAHTVGLPGFWITVHEITADQFAPFRYRNFDGDVGPTGAGSFDADAVTRPSPPYEDPSHGMGTGDHPATGMTRWNALHYARWLSQKTGRLFRLPTEAEWEYACRAGVDGPFGFQEAPSAVTEYAWLESNSGGTHHPVGTRRPNNWGLFDMHGNVAEWVMDGYDPVAYERRAGQGVTTEPMEGSPARGQGLVRGGAFDDVPEEARCAERYPESPIWKRRDPQVPKSRWWNTDAPHVGFRLMSPAGDRTPDQIRDWWIELLGG